MPWNDRPTDTLSGPTATAIAGTAAPTTAAATTTAAAATTAAATIAAATTAATATVRTTQSIRVGDGGKDRLKLSDYTQLECVVALRCVVAGAGYE